jgi:hypothetical protein
MAVWEVRTIKQYGDRFWENVWHLDIGADTDVSATMIDAFRDFDRSLLRDIYTLARIVRRPAGTTDAFIEVILGLAGLLASTGKVLPLFNTVRILLNVGAGRPGQKFLRGYLTDADLSGDDVHIESASVSQVEDAVFALLNTASSEGYTFVESGDDKPVSGAAVQALVQMRQLHRKRRRST